MAKFWLIVIVLALVAGLLFLAATRRIPENVIKLLVFLGIMGAIALALKIMSNKGDQIKQWNG